MALFIGGYARTGTTLMQGIICSDPAAFPVTQEASCLTALLHAYDHLLKLPKRIEDYFGTQEHFAQYHRDTVTRYLDHICGRFGRDKVIVQKDPQLTLYFHHLAGFVARSRFIVMVRDPRDAVASQIRRKSQPGFRPHANIFLTEYLQRYDAVLSRRPEFGDRILFVRFERLISDTAAVINELRTFTGLPLSIDPAADGWKTVRAPDSETSSPHDGTALSTEPIGRHKGILNDNELRLIESARPRLAQAFGFDVFCRPEET